jgi:HK97 family phage major capsid protein
MPTTLELIQKREKIIVDMKEAVKKGDAARAKGEAATDYDAEFDRSETEERSLSKQIAQQQRLDELAKEEAGKHLEDLDKRGGAPGGSAEKEYRDAFTQWFRHGQSTLSAEERELLKSGKVTEQRAQSTTTTAGGYLIAPEYLPELERAIKDYSGVMQVARMISTSTGANLPWPTTDGTARKAALVAENATSTPTDFVFGQKSLDAYMYRDMAAASLELIQDSAFDIGEFIAESFSESFGRGLNEHFTTGSGSGQPNGLVTASTAGTTAASATAFTRSELVDHMHKIDPGYRKSKKCGWMMNDLILAAIKKLSLGSGDASPLWQISMRDSEPDRIEGFPYWINQDMSSALTTGQKIILFGDYNKYIVRRVLGMVLRRLEERFIDNGQIGFIAFARYDAELSNTAAVKHLKLA